MLLFCRVWSNIMFCFFMFFSLTVLTSNRLLSRLYSSPVLHRGIYKSRTPTHQSHGCDVKLTNTQNMVIHRLCLQCVEVSAVLLPISPFWIGTRCRSRSRSWSRSSLSWSSLSWSSRSSLSWSSRSWSRWSSRSCSWKQKVYQKSIRRRNWYKLCIVLTEPLL